MQVQSHTFIIHKQLTYITIKLNDMNYETNI